MRRRALLGASAGMLGGALLPGCARRDVPKDRTVATLWFSYGGKNREVLLDLVARFNAEQRQDFVLPTYQGDYFEALAKLRTALAAFAADHRFEYFPDHLLDQPMRDGEAHTENAGPFMGPIDSIHAAERGFKPGGPCG